MSEASYLDFLSSSSLKREEISNSKKYKDMEVMSFKRYKSALSLELKFNWELDEARLGPIFQQRRSLRKYSDKPLLIEDIAFMLWASQGITAKAGKHFFRTVPSAGALYPFETYVQVNNVSGLKPGLYHFDVINFALEYINDQAKSEELAHCCLEQKFINDAGAVFLWTGVPSRNLSKYGERGFRYLLLDIGHVCQNLLIGAEAKGCGGCPIAAFFDAELNSFLAVDGEHEFALYAAAVGKKLPKAETTPQDE